MQLFIIYVNKKGTNKSFLFKYYFLISLIQNYIKLISKIIRVLSNTWVHSIIFAYWPKFIAPVFSNFLVSSL